jgi:hypothetical protein
METAMEDSGEKPTWLQRLWRRVVLHDAPHNLGGCLDCNKPECPPEHWSTCKRRQAGIGGESAD